MIKSLFLAALAFLFFAVTPEVQAASKKSLDASGEATLSRLFYRYPSTRYLADRAAGILVFPNSVRAGFGFGGEYGEGVLMRRNKDNEYYNIISASVGFQLGIQARSIIIMFLNDTALDNFRNSDGWKVGIDGSIAIINLGIGANVDTDEISSAVVGMVIDHRGLMYNLTLEGSKITRISR